MRKFGKQVEVSNNMGDYMIGIMAPSGFGKTTLMYQVCEKQFGPEGYIILDAGQEDGVAALQGAVAEKVLSWNIFKDIVDDIAKNKKTDYKDLKVLVLDTLDATFEIAEKYAIDDWNAKHMNDKGFVRATSINSVEGGFGRGMDAVINNVKEQIAKLRAVGVNIWWTAHVKEKDQSDLYSGTTYTTLTANMAMKYFNSIKNSSHIVAFGYFDRSIEITEIGSVNPVNKKKKERSSVVGELRKVKFRDDALVADAKCRFSDIIDEINLNADDFIEAVTSAIKAEQNKVVTPCEALTKASVESAEPVDAPVAEAVAETVEKSADSRDALFAEIRSKFSKSTNETKLKVKEILSAAGESKLSESVSTETLNEIIAVLC